MSGYKTHLLFYFALTEAIFYLLGEFKGFDLFSYVGLTGVLAGAVYCLLPDLDSPSSKIRWTITGLLVGAAALMLAYNLFYEAEEMTIFSLAAVAALLLLWLTRHRGLMHTPAAGFAVSLPLFLAGPQIFLMAFFGYLTHLLLDGVIFK